MKAFFADGYGKGGIRIIPIPVIGPDEVLIKVCYCGVCGTDQDLFSSDCSFAKNGQVTYPDRLGHEWSGIVEKVGDKVTSLVPGDRVVGDNGVVCGKCAACKRGDFDNCLNTRCVGTINPVYDGAFAEYFKLPEKHTHKIPDGVSLKEATLFEPLSVAYGGIKHMNINKDSFVSIIGTGCIALSAAALAKSLGAERIFIIGRNPVKLAIAEKLGIKTINIREEDPVERIMKETDGVGSECVLECSGAAGSFVQAIALASKKATVALIGFYELPEKEVNIDPIVSKSLNIVGVMGEFANMVNAIKIIGKSKIDLSPIITDQLPFDQCLPAFTRKNYPNSIKTVIEINKE